METAIDNKYIETEDDVKSIIKGIEDVKNGKVMDVDTAMKKFFIEREVWKSIK